MAEEINDDKIIFIDSNALIHRAYHAYPASLSTKDGELTNAVFGFTKTLLEIIAKFSPKYIVCVFDSGKPTFRHEEYSEYKANRKKMDDELRQQFPRARQVVEAFNIPLFVQEGFEADDLIGTLVNEKSLAGLKKIVVTGDQDILQLVDDDKGTSVYMAGTSFSASKEYTVEEVRKRYEFNPLQMIDFKSLLGDASDNIPGVRGIGKKGALELIKQFVSLEGVYESLEKEDAIWQEQPFKRMYKKLKAGKESALMSKYLATIVTDIPLSFSVSDSEVQDYDKDKVKDLFIELQFRTLMSKLPVSNGDEHLVVKQPGKQQMGMFSEGVKNEIKISKNSKYSVIAHSKEALAALDELEKKDRFAFDTETDSLDPMRANIVGLGFSWKEGEAIYLSEDVLLDDEIKEKLLRIFKEAQGKKQIIAHNLKYDLHIMSNYLGETLSNTEGYFDTLIAIYLLNAGEGSLSKGLKDLAFNRLGMEMNTLSELTGKKGKEAINVRDLDTEVLGQYCCSDCDATIQLYQLFEQELKGQENLDRLFKEIEMPLVGVLIKMEREGIHVDIKVIQALGEEAGNMVRELEKSIYDTAGETFNISSPKQVGEILFDKLAIHTESGQFVTKTKTGAYSTDERTLKNFAGKYKIVDEILLYRELTKLISTYITGLQPEIVPETGKIHTNYNQTIASTGRLSSTNPNLQNIPVSSEIGRKIRKAFTAGKGRKLVSFDYAQQELRLLAHLSGEDKLITAFAEDIDIHSLTASQILETPIEQVTKSQRRIGKTVNFGVVYGISGFGLADRLKIERKNADEFIAKFFERYPKVRQYFDDLKQQAREKGEIFTLKGRRRDATALNSKNSRIRAAVEREITNFPLQGGAADIMKMAMLKVDKVISEKFPEVKLHLQVHDEIIFSVPNFMTDAELSKFTTEVCNLMAGVVSLKVPMDVDFEVGDNWYDL